MSLFTPVSFSKEQKIFAVGDIHGCYEELINLMQKLKDEADLQHEDAIIFLGDYVDRGPKSRKVLEFLINLKEEYPNSHFLRGNHEDMILHFLGFEGHYGPWCIVNGADMFFRDYGLENFYLWNGDGETVHINYPYTEKSIREELPGDHLEFLLMTELALISDEFIFVHAGIDPWETLDKQSSEEICWVREMFLNWQHNEPQIIVHGHTPIKLPCHNEQDRKVNLDTGCFKGNLLSAVELRSMEFYSVPSRQPEDW